MLARRWLFLTLLAPLAAFGQQAAASDSLLEARTAEVAKTLRCPVCQGESIQDSPADLAQQMRGLVRDMLREGKTPDEIRAYFVGRYGEWILLEPKMKGLNLILYILPIVLIIGGAVFILRFVRNSSKSAADSNVKVLQ
jgi:cytochrome c-type biogenesis protein CcmH